jgi:AcrR family transcriptional regulator
MNQGIIHYYFESKEALFDKLVETLFNNAASNIELLAASDLAPMDKLMTFCDFGQSLPGPRRDEWIA